MRDSTQAGDRARFANGVHVIKRVVSEAVETVKDVVGWAHFAWVLGGSFKGFLSRMVEYGEEARARVTARESRSGEGAMTTGQDFVDACRAHGTNGTEFENAALSIGREFLPACALAVLDDDGQPSSDYWAWLISQLEGGGK